MDFTSRTEILDLALRLWIRLRDTGSNNKIKALKNLGVYNQMSAQCPLCEYGDRVAIKNGTSKCKECRDIFSWNGLYNHCMDSDSYYKLWHDSENVEDRRYYAGKMVKLIQYNIDNRKDIYI